MTSPPPRRIGRLGGLLAVLATAAWLLWPSALGGGTTLVQTHGNSMEPDFRTGDLAVLRAAVDYEVGDVVAFRSSDMGTTVMHRIVAREGDHFLTQGDNNSWLDPGTLAPSDVLGRLWFGIPGGGDVLAVLRTPLVLALLALTVGAAMWWFQLRPGRSGGRTRRTPSMPVRARARQVAVGATVLAALSATGAAVLLLVPATGTTARTVQVDQRGSWSYSGTAAEGITYPSGTLTTGDPVYTALVRTLAVRFDVEVDAAALEHVAGDLRLDVTMAAPDGWAVPLHRGAPAEVDGGVVSSVVSIDLVGALDLLQRHYAEVGGGGGAATLTVAPVGEVHGAVAGRPFTAAEMPALPLVLDPIALRLTGAPDELLEPIAQTAVTVEEVSSHRFPVFGLPVPVGPARVVTVVIALGAALVAAAAARMGWHRSRSTVDEFLVRHAGRILEVRSFTLGATVIDVTDPEALHMVAERLDSLVLHHTGPYGHLFAVQDADTTYCHMVA